MCIRDSAHIGHYTGLIHLGREVMGSKNTVVNVMPKMEEFLRNNGPWSQLVKLNNITLNGLKNNETYWHKFLFLLCSLMFNILC